MGKKGGENISIDNVNGLPATGAFLPKQKDGTGPKAENRTSTRPRPRPRGFRGILYCEISNFDGHEAKISPDDGVSCERINFQSTIQGDVSNIILHVPSIGCYV